MIGAVAFGDSALFPTFVEFDGDVSFDALVSFEAFVVFSDG
jgi:hypothetical protein